MPFATKEKRREWAQRTRDERNKTAKRFRERHPGYHCERVTASPEAYLQQLLYLARNRQKDCDIDLDYLMKLWGEQLGLCAVSKRQMTHQRIKGTRVLSNISIDRIDNSIGYKKGNIRLVCYIVNSMKSSFTNEEFLDWCRAITEGTTT